MSSEQLRNISESLRNASINHQSKSIKNISFQHDCYINKHEHYEQRSNL